MTDVRCGCSNPGVIGCTCTLIDSTSVNVSGAGSTASPYSGVPIIDGAAGNIVSCGSDGLLAEFPDAKANVRCAIVSTAIAATTDTAISFGAGTEVYDDDGMHDTAVNPTRFTAVAAAGGAGLYLCYARGHCDDTVDIQKMWFRRQANFNFCQIAKGTNRLITIQGAVRLALNEYVELMYRSEVATNFSGQVTITRLGGF